MRRIPRPSRAIDAAVRQSTHARPWTTAATTASPTATAAFSTSAAHAFLLPGKQDKKKHQQFVRRWQKRLLGDSEPIGAHVDPYDPTSPVRIAPEEQGEYEEVLDEDATRRGRSHHGDEYLYLPAEEMGVERPGAKLMHVGGERWLQRKAEGDLAKEFEKLTRQTYTPLSLDMANDIETLTGTPYTLRDENLAMAQTTHEVTGRPYTRYDFGLQRKVTQPEQLHRRFSQAVAEVHALKEAGLDLDLAKLPNRGIYKTPRWVRDIRLQQTESGELVLVYPAHKTAEHFIRAIQSMPDWESTQASGDDAVLVDEAADLLDPVLPQEPLPTMDPATPAFKRAAVVKIDSEKKPFDFMSNRPVPRAQFADIGNAQEADNVTNSTETSLTLGASRLNELTSALETSESAVNALRQSILSQKSLRVSDGLAASGSDVRQSKAVPPSSQVAEVKWRHVIISDSVEKFALFKRIFQLTGLRISDPHLSSSRTLGDLYGHLCAAARPQPTSLFSAIHIEGQKARERAKQHISAQVTPRKKADLGDLISLGNVEIRRVKANETEKRTKTGMDKVVEYALWERGLSKNISSQSTNIVEPNPLGLRLGFSRARKASDIVEGTISVPQFGQPLSMKAAGLLAKRTRDQIEEVEGRKLASNRA